MRRVFLAAIVCAATPIGAQDRSYSWGYNSFGSAGLIDMPSAFGRPDAELAFTSSYFKNQARQNFTFQVSDRLSATFRYAILSDIRRNPDGDVIPERFDRSFSFQYRFADEGRYVPALAIGINDIIGTGIYGGEYIVASKTLSPQLRATAGLGWGRLGSHNGFSNPLAAVLGDGFEARPVSVAGLGGKLDSDVWFHGDAALFGGVEWMASDQLRLIAEYSSDDYAREDDAAFSRKSPLNFGASLRVSENATIDLRYLYGSEIGVQLSYDMNPKVSVFGSGRDGAPLPVLRRETQANQLRIDPAEPSFAQIASAALFDEGIVLDGLQSNDKVLRIQIRNDRCGMSSQALGRAARVLTRIAPAHIETFDMRLSMEGAPVTSVIVQRRDLEELEFHPVATDLMRARTIVMDTTNGLPPVDGRFPKLTYGFEPFASTSLFDPDAPLRMDVGVSFAARYEMGQGFVLSGRVNQRLAGNLSNSTRISTSVLEHVRSDAYLYDKSGDTTVQELTGAYYFRPADNVFGRVTAGYLERMFGGVSAELLWKPQNSRLALGAEVNYAKQRDFNQLFGFQDYETFTGHLSAYYDIGGGFHGQLDVGQYLAGDLGGTVTLTREFDNGWRVGAFATITDVSAADFGEGSFDKGIVLTVPIDWITGQPSKTKLDTVIRPVLRDGGARVNVQGRLYPSVRQLQATDIDATWGRFWR